MKRYATGIVGILATGMALTAAVWLARKQPWNQKPAPASLPAAAVIDTERPGRQNFSLRLQWFGAVESKGTVRLTALVPGQVVSVKVADGAFVKRGTRLFALGGPRLTGRLETLKQRVTTLEKQVALAQSIVHTKQDAVAEKMARREELQTARGRLVQLNGELAAARQELAACQDAVSVRSPIDGVFTNRRVTAGQEVEKGTHLADVISTGLRIAADLFPPAGVSLEGKAATVQSASGAAIGGTVKKVLRERTASGATAAWIEGEDIDQSMVPGETASGEVVLAVRKGALAVPREAIVRDEQERTFVFVKGPHSYQKRAVKTGLASGGWIEVVSGLSEEDAVVVRGAYELFYRDFSRTYRVAD